MVLGTTACAGAGPSTRGLHYVDGELVYSDPVPSSAYAAYLRARLAMQSDPPQTDVARVNLEHALRYSPDDPQLWTARAEVEAADGDDDAAVAAAEHALALQPDYAPARRLLVKLGGGHAVVQRNASP